MVCSEQSNDWYFLALRLLSIIETALALLTAYCIVFKSPAVLKGFKWILLGQQLNILVFQLYAADVVKALALFPATCVVFYGHLNDVISPFAQFAIIVVLIAGLFAFTTELFEYRHQRIVPPNSSADLSRCSRRILTLYRIVAVCCSGIPFMPFVSDENAAKEQWANVIPCELANAERDKQQSRMILFEFKDFLSGFLLVLAMFLPMIGELTFYPLHSFMLLSSRTTPNISERTRILQKAFLKALIIQEVVPLAMIYPVPVGYLMLSTLTGFSNMDFNRVCVVILLSHGVLASFAVLLTNRPYRQFVADQFRPKSHQKARSPTKIASS